MSLKCPLSTMRMHLPCRSTVCNHNQCFDASSFLQVQEQAPQWSCPICTKTFTFENLAIDQYVLDILKSTPKSTEQITIEPDGTWRQGAPTEDFRIPMSLLKRKPPESWDYEDLVDITDHRITDLKGDSSSTSQSHARTPLTTSSREASTAASTAPRSNGSKRAADDIIDLTLSDDDDEPPHRPMKRQSVGTGIGSLAQPSRLSLPARLLPQNENTFNLPQPPGSLSS